MLPAPPRLTFEEDTHTYKWDGKPVPSVTTVLQDVGMIDYTRIPEDIREFALERGRYVHLATELYDYDDLDWDTVVDEIKGYVRGYTAFKRETGFKPALIEMRGYSKVYGYAGTLDRAGILNGHKALIDFKSGMVQGWVAIQLAAYERLLPPEWAGSARYALELRKDGTYRLSNPYTNPMDFNIFTYALEVFRWKQIHR